MILFDDKAIQPCKRRTRSWVEINYKLQGAYNDNNNNNIKFKTSMITPNLCNYNDADIHVKGIIIVPNTASAGVSVNNTSQKLILE